MESLPALLDTFFGVLNFSQKCAIKNRFLKKELNSEFIEYHGLVFFLQIFGKGNFKRKSKKCNDKLVQAYFEGICKLVQVTIIVKRH